MAVLGGELKLFRLRRRFTAQVLKAMPLQFFVILFIIFTIAGGRRRSIISGFGRHGGFYSAGGFGEEADFRAVEAGQVVAVVFWWWFFWKMVNVIRYFFMMKLTEEFKKCGRRGF